MSISRKMTHRIELVFHRRWGWFLGMALLLLAFSAGAALPAVYSGHGGSHFAGCLDTNKGTLYNVKVDTTAPVGPTCQRGDVVVRWSDGDGDITEVTPGTGLTGGGSAGQLSLGADATYLQRRVNAECATGSSIRAINSDGGIVCEPDTDTTYSVGPVTIPPKISPLVMRVLR